MSVTDPDATAVLHDQVRLLGDRAEISQLCDRYVMHLDRDRHDDSWLTAVFTDDAWLTFPFGEYRGLAGLAEFQDMARTNVARTHHMSANHHIEVDGDTARVRVHLVAVHVPGADEPGRHFDIGGHYEATAVRTPAGWRLRRLVFDLVWADGQPPEGRHP